MAAGTASRIAHLLALMNNGDDIRPGQPGQYRRSVTRKGAPGLWPRPLSRSLACRRGSRNLRDASSSGQATSSGKGEHIGQGG